VMVWLEFIWLRIGSSGGSLWDRQRRSGFRKWQGIYSPAEWLLASQEGLCSTVLNCFNFCVAGCNSAEGICYLPVVWVLCCSV
jgi:hypothetical protein